MLYFSIPEEEFRKDEADLSLNTQILCETYNEYLHLYPSTILHSFLSEEDYLEASWFFLEGIWFDIEMQNTRAFYIDQFLVGSNVDMKEYNLSSDKVSSDELWEGDFMALGDLI